ncbi:hypothetical protein D9Q98_004037 [Chlorella vulgaris]|uniref:Uncharacterized protein n=1 Tax=Chlorella vulgaris TaxID=3077 RepID=A0A9D4YY91_CHLVU|nr:hypothetical protein D9Q98_004037 [Chlorella vulgaris]
MPVTFDDSVAAKYPWAPGGLPFTGWLPRVADTHTLPAGNLVRVDSAARHTGPYRIWRGSAHVQLDWGEHTCVNLLELRFANPRGLPLHHIVHRVALEIGISCVDTVYPGEQLDWLLEHHARGPVKTTCGTTRVPLPLGGTHAEDLLPLVRHHVAKLKVDVADGHSLEHAHLEVWAMCYAEPFGMPVPALTGDHGPPAPIENPWRAGIAGAATTGASTHISTVHKNAWKNPAPPGKRLHVVRFWAPASMTIECMAVWPADDVALLTVLASPGVPQEVLATWEPEPAGFEDPRVRAAAGCLRMLPPELVSRIVRPLFVRPEPRAVIPFSTPVNPNTANLLVELQLREGVPADTNFGYATVGLNAMVFFGGLFGLMYGG